MALEPCQAHALTTAIQLGLAQCGERILRNRRLLQRCPCGHLHRFPQLPLVFRAGASARLLLCPHSERPSSRHTTAQADEIGPSHWHPKGSSYLSLTQPWSRKRVNLASITGVPDVRFGS